MKSRPLLPLAVGKDQCMKRDEQERQVKDAVPPEHAGEEDEVDQDIVERDNESG